MGNYYESFEPTFVLWREPADKSLAKNVKAYERDDAEIIADIEDLFVALHGINTSPIKIECDKNKVTLSGTCANSQIKNYLGRLAENVLGVRDVKNNIDIDFLNIE